MGQNKPKGFVMVIGGGIAGIQAALSLADAHYGIYLVERAASLGGMMPSLHRIYPLCSCCKLDPRIAACEQNPNIAVMLDTQVQDISGELGQFNVTLRTGNKEKDVKVGAVILAAGIETFDPSKYEDYAYGRFPNVITSVEYEQRQKPLGPEAGVLKRPSDGKKPESIAWLQCVGSRDINQCDAPYCSSVCCMHALKEAVNTKEVSEDTETAIFYMDMRTHGKGFEDYLNQALERGVDLIRSRVHTVDPVPDSDDLAIKFTDEKGELHQKVFDMIVLSVGLRPSKEAIKLAEKMGLTLTGDTFVGTTPFKPVSTDKPGIFVCGGVAGPFDIGQSITQAAAAVSEVSCVLEAQSFSPPPSYPEPEGGQDQEPKVLLAYHLCPGMPAEIGKEIEKYGKTLPSVAGVSAVEGDLASAVSGQLKETGANRLVFSSCTPGIHRSLLQEALARTGLNPYLYELIDLRVLDPGTASTQVRDRIRMGVARAAFMSPPTIQEVSVKKRALVVGGGVSGLESALAIAGEGYPVTLVEKEKALGGHGRHVRATWQGYDVQGYLKGLISAVEKNKNITVLTEANVKENKGFAGNFLTTVHHEGKDKDIAHGVTVLAPGGEPLKPSEYLYGQHDGVNLWSEISAKMIEDPSALQKASCGVFVQCVGSREPSCPHCSNLCCSFAVRTAVDLKTENPDMSIYILYREMRTFGERENVYREAREKGIVFIRYDLDSKPVVEASGKDRLKVKVHDPILDKILSIEADFISLQTAIMGKGNEDLARIFRVNMDSDGFLAETPEKLGPVDSTTKGVFMAGLAVYPKDTGESITQAKAASARALEILARDTVQVGGLVAEVMPDKCAVCCTCVRTCPFDVPLIDPERGAAYIDPGLCQGCGMCVAECPGKAIVMATCSDDMLAQAPAVLLATS